jgi:hypothetical protein
MKNKNELRLIIASVIILVLISACAHDENGINNGNDPVDPLPNEFKALYKTYCNREELSVLFWNLIA